MYIYWADVVTLLLLLNMSRLMWKLGIGIFMYWPTFCTYVVYKNYGKTCFFEVKWCMRPVGDRIAWSCLHPVTPSFFCLKGQYHNFTRKALNWAKNGLKKNLNKIYIFTMPLQFATILYSFFFESNNEFILFSRVVCHCSILCVLDVFVLTVNILRHTVIYCIDGHR